MEHPDDLLEEFAFGEEPDVGPHVAECTRCSAHVSLARQVAGWLASSHSAPPPPALRSRVLAAAVGVRPPSTGSAFSAYVSQAADFEVLLDSLSPAQWALPTADGRTVEDLVRHLAGNDGNVLADLGSPTPPPGRARDFGSPAPPSGRARDLWREQSDLLMRTVGRAEEALLSRPVRLAGKTPMRRPLREAMMQRAFETWIHRDDIRAAVALPPEAPSPAHLARIVGFGLALLPGAMDAAGRGRSGAVRLFLTGPGSASHVVPLSSSSAVSSPSLAQVEIPADRFGRLMAGRVPVTPGVAVIDGSRTAALDLLTVAATLGCE
ncbi:maleylpyruvate isomerase family mycothiol-dependent enzyme [Actinoplanes sp. CA-142083]|uniref:maleylpyruvate isomerase family mycothiol-dependent enzyme n=1 Tax=Actinoplanes sp. CA-142083 TaxID=3239903 RepID=UPI003D8A3983